MRRSLLVLALAVAAAPFAAAADDAPPGPDDPARLREQKVLIGSQSFWSVSTPYKSADFPYFITSDSLVFAWHSLMAESVARVELRRYGALADAIREMREALPAAVAAVAIEGDVAGRAERRVRIVLATATLLLGGEAPKDAPGVLEVARAEASRIEAGNEVGKPDWYAPPDPDFLSIDYARFRPTDVAAAIPEVARGQRAVRWLGFLPFRIGRDDELLSFLLLRKAAEASDAARDAFAGYPVLLGEGDEPSLFAEGLPTPDRLTASTFASFRRRALAAAPAAPVRDRSMAPDHAPEPTLRLLPVAAPPCSRLLADVSERRAKAGEDRLPSGRAVGAALGSAAAAESLDPPDEEAVAAARNFAGGKTHYERFLRCLSRLSEPPDGRAPAFFAGPAWREKTLLTTMSGWTLLRHVWSVRVKSTAAYFGAEDSAGFVEPYPRFFAGLARLARDTAERFAELGTDGTSLAVAKEAAELDAIAAMLEELGRDALAALEPPERWRRIGATCEEYPVLRGRSDLYYRLSRLLNGPAGFPDREAFARAVADCRRAARELRETGRTCLPGSGRDCAPAGHPVGARWARLAETADRLAALARKELEGTPFSPADDAWIRAYGRTLATLLDERPTGDPTDDAPVATAVFSDPATGRWRIEAVGRPRALWVLWPKGEEEILCRGVVLPWEEFESPRPVTGEEWRRRLDSR